MALPFKKEAAPWLVGIQLNSLDLTRDMVVVPINDDMNKNIVKLLGQLSFLGN